MNALIEAAFARSRTVLSVLLLLLVAGAVVYRDIPKESDPDVQIPIIYVSMSHDGISPEDAERLLVRPMEQELQSIEGVKEMRSVADEGHAAVTLEFEAGIDIDGALQDVREKVDIAKAELPEDTDEPTVNEVNIALFPVLVVTLSGDVPERTLLRLARDLKDRVKALPNVLDVDIAGDREELLEIVIDPLRVESYGLRQEELLELVSRSNRLVAAGALDTGQGRFAVKVPGVFETLQDVLELPIKVEGDRVVTLGDIAEVRRTFKDPEGFARVDGRPAIALEVSKRIGANIIDTIEQVRAVVERERGSWPEAVQVGYSQDKSDNIRSMLLDLQNNVLSAVLLVMIVVVAALGWRSAGLVGLAVPGSFLTGILVLGTMGLTVNIVVLFALILAVGMLVDGAIVVTELADRKMAEGLDRREAYRIAATRMAWPITASTATTLAAFMPLLFWPGVVGEFMKFLPVTLLATLTASLLMALIFVPNLGALVGRPEAADPETMRLLSAAEGGDLNRLRGPTGAYVRLLRRLLPHPGKVFVAAMVIAVGSYAAYGMFGRGVEFFPDVEPEVAQLQVHARGDLSVHERDALVREVEERVLGLDGIATMYSRSGVSFRGEELDEDVIGIIQLEFEDWRDRRPAREILAKARARAADLAGVRIEVREQEAGPGQGKPIKVQLSSRRPERLEPVVQRVREHLEGGVAGLRDVSDSRPIPGLEWKMVVDRAKAGRFGADVALVGGTVQLVTNGVLVGSYRPDDADDEIDIRARYPFDERNLATFDQLRINTPMGAVPLANFVTREPAPRVGTLNRADGRRVLTVSADVEEGVLVDDKVREIRAWLAAQSFDPAVQVEFKGEDEDQREAQAFLSRAFGVALFLIAIILVTQFNSFYQSALILSAVVFSTVGVLLGLLVTQQPFGIVMSGVGVIALAGIVVNNNIVLIDTYNDLRRRGLEPFEAVLRTGAQRLRPVMLTTVTTILGLMPMVTRVNIDLFSRTITVGGPSTDWWVQLATAVAGGLAFATVLTLVLTPCLLVLGANVGAWIEARRERRAAAREERGQAAAEPEAALLQAAE
ncbi:MAG TPA: efflux RND transporter permease subunit [Geminicoccaceae bacterium]|nr:efflux RND transporter permease subunit [Geminicoccaceae bacterium]